jgi:hypothetical protein
MYTACIKTKHDPFFSTINVLPALHRQLVNRLRIWETPFPWFREATPIWFLSLPLSSPLPELTKETVCRRQQGYGMPMFPEKNDNNSNYR